MTIRIYQVIQVIFFNLEHRVYPFLLLKTRSSVKPLYMLALSRFLSFANGSDPTIGD